METNKKIGAAECGDLVRTIIVDSTVTCRMRRSDVIDNANIRPGDVIVGLSSTGQATYERRYNGGMGSNGLTSARHDVFAKYLAAEYPESFDHAVPDALVYSGKYRLTDPVSGSPLNAGQLVLSPTRTYAPVIKRILDEMRHDIHGMVHCTGGAQTKVLHFVSGDIHDEKIKKLTEEEDIKRMKEEIAKAEKEKNGVIEDKPKEEKKEKEKQEEKKEEVKEEEIKIENKVPLPRL